MVLLISRVYWRSSDGRSKQARGFFGLVKVLRVVWNKDPTLATGRRSRTWGNRRTAFSGLLLDRGRGSRLRDPKAIAKVF